MPYRTTAIASVLAVAVSCAWAGTPTSPGQTNPLPIDACALLSASEISATIEMAVNAGVRDDAGLVEDGSYSSSCVWIIQQGESEADDPAAPLGGKNFVILNAMQWPVASGLARNFLDAFREAARHGEIPQTPAPRQFGDEALWWGDGLAVRKGDVSFGISVFAPGTDLPRGGVIEERLAPLVLRQLAGR